MATDAARQAVLTNAEFLELILLQLPARTVFGTQRVCHQFHDCVAASVLLQRKLFLTPPSDIEETWTLVHAPGSSNTQSQFSHLTGLPLTAVVRIPPTGNIPPNVFGPPGGFLRQAALHLGPFWKHSTDHAESLMITARMRETEKLSFKLYGVGLLGEASWKRTYLTTSPCKSVAVHLDWLLATKPVTRGRSDLNIASTGDPNGFTIGPLLDLLLQVEEKPRWYAIGARSKRHSGLLVDLLQRLEAESGKKVVVAMLRVEILGVIVPTEEERKTVKDA
ncbi:hypothetical protein LTR56_006666 [Elasticomyces elasticus]|nr:hypothetical protein LTR22_012831 [Elasticomyces elasticus]KAK3649767.1 hypothetical protein LTR56_006666 [Elasticomyces elasticus]KAK4918102.1 hypothetical protein LTR49_014106 [Elasticomyces elasticus]